jgi:hypothetical protein
VAKLDLTKALTSVQRQRLLKVYAGANLLAAVTFLSVGAFELLKILYGTGGRSNISFSNAMELMDRSLMHSGLAGVALLGAAVITYLADSLVASRASSDWWTQFLPRQTPTGQKSGQN